MGFTVIEPLLSEAKSAKAPGRPVFDAMMKKVDQGEIRGILCWKLDRLARNPVDGGRIIWAIKQHGLVVRTPHQTFSQAEDNIILMYIEFGIAPTTCPLSRPFAPRRGRTTGGTTSRWTTTTNDGCGKARRDSGQQRTAALSATFSGAEW